LCTFASQPSAGLLKIFIQIFHHQVDGAAMSPADEATEGVLAHLERERGVYQLFTFLKLRNDGLKGQKATSPGQRPG